MVRGANSTARSELRFPEGIFTASNDRPAPWHQSCQHFWNPLETPLYLFLRTISARATPPLPPPHMVGLVHPLPQVPTTPSPLPPSPPADGLSQANPLRECWNRHATNTSEVRLASVTPSTLNPTCQLHAMTYSCAPRPASRGGRDSVYK